METFCLKSFVSSCAIIHFSHLVLQSHWTNFWIKDFLPGFAIILCSWEVLQERYTSFLRPEFVSHCASCFAAAKFFKRDKQEFCKHLCLIVHPSANFFICTQGFASLVCVPLCIFCSCIGSSSRKTHLSFCIKSFCPIVHHHPLQWKILQWRQQ